MLDANPPVFIRGEHAWIFAHPITHSTTPHKATPVSHRLQSALIIPYRCRNACQVAADSYQAPKERQTRLCTAPRFLNLRPNKAPQPLSRGFKALSDHALSRSENVTRTPSEILRRCLGKAASRAGFLCTSVPRGSKRATRVRRGEKMKNQPLR